MNRTLRFLKSLAVPLVLLLTLGAGRTSAQTYCSPQYSNGCTFDDYIDNFSLTGAGGTSFSQTATGCPSGNSGYSDFTALTPVSLIPCNTYTGSLSTGFGSQTVRIFIDFNNDGFFDSTANSPEIVGNVVVASSNTATSFTINIPTGVSAGNRRMRVRCAFAVTPPAVVNPCGLYTYGEVHDYTVAIGALAACSGTPVAGTASASVPNVCPSQPFSVTLAGAACLSGLSYQLQTSATGATGSYANSGTSQISPVFSIPGITTTTYYRIVTTCSSTGGGIATSVADTVPVNSFTTCYCSPQTGTTLHTFANDYFSNVTIAGTTMNSSNGMSSTSGFSQIPPTPASNTASLAQGVTYTITATYNASAGTPFGAGVWIDYDANGIFNQTTEYIPLTMGSTSATATFTVPSGATVVAQTGLRIRAHATTITADPCASYWAGETEDRLVSIIAGTPCGATVSGGTAVASVASVCPSIPFTISATGITTGQTGLSYQLQVSTTGAAGSYTNTGTAQSTPTFTIAGITATRYYRIVVSCTGTGGGTANSVADTVTINPVTACYCNTSLGGFCGPGNGSIDNFSFNTLSNLNNGCSATGPGGAAYTVFPATGTNTTTVVIGSPYTVTIGTNSAAITSVWIDYNQDGQWTAAEHTQVNLNSSNATATITIPTTALPGTTGMRVRSRLTGNQNGPNDACINMGSGETEDYTINLVAPVPCSGTPNTGTANTSSATPCPGTQVTISLTGGTIASNISYQLQSSTTSSTAGFTNTGTSNTSGIFTVSPPPGAIWYRIVSTCNNTGGGFANSASVQVTGGTPISTLPWNEGIEGVTTTGPTNFPPCWRKVSGDWQSADASFTTYHDPRTGLRYLINNWIGTNHWMMTPGFQLTAGTSYDFSFYWAGDGFDGWDGAVGVNNIQDSTGITLLGQPYVTQSVTTSTSYTQAIRTFTPTTSGVYYFGVRVGSNGGPWYLGFDDFRVNITPTCPQPTVLPPTGVTAAQANLNWSPATTAPALGYQWEVRTSGMPGSGTTGFIGGGSTGSAVTTATVTGLSGVTTYSVYVRAICSPGDSSFWASTTFTTPCSFFTLPFTQNFGGTFPPACWSFAQGQLSATPTALTPATFSSWFGSSYMNTGSNPAARINIWNSFLQQEWLISPSIDLGTTPGNFQLEFNLAIVDYASSTPSAIELDDTVAVVISTNNGATWSSANALQIWNSVNTPINPTGTTPGSQRFFLPLNGYSGQIKIGWYGTNGGVWGNEDNDIFVDSVRLISTCTPPTYTLGNDTAICGNVSSLVLNGGTGPTGTTYAWSNSYNNVTDTTQTFNAAPVLNALNASPNSLVNVVTFFSTVSVGPNCAKNDTVSIAVTYTPRVSSITSTLTGLNQYDFAPVGDSFATGYVWNFGDGGVASTASATHAYTQPGTYNVCLVVSNPCGADSACTTVTITAGVDDVLADGSTVRVFPNPTAADATLEVNGGATLRSYQVMSATGALVQEHTIKGKGVTRTAVNTDALAPGIYTLRIQLDKGVIVRKLEVLK